MDLSLLEARVLLKYIPNVEVHLWHSQRKRIPESLTYCSLQQKVEEFEAVVICSRTKWCQERSEIRQDLSKTGVIYAIYL